MHALKIVFGLMRWHIVADKDEINRKKSKRLPAYSSSFGDIGAGAGMGMNNGFPNNDGELSTLFQCWYLTKHLFELNDSLSHIVSPLMQTDVFK